MTSEPKKDILLKGSLACATRLETLLLIEGNIVRNVPTEEDPSDELKICGSNEAVKRQNEKAAKIYLIKNCSDDVMHSINPTDTFLGMMAKLNAAYGFANMDPSVILGKLRTISFNPSKDPAIMLNQINKWTAELESAGGSISDAQLVQLMVDGLTGDQFKDNFWFHCYGKLKMDGLKTYTSDSTGKFICKFWHAYKTQRNESESSNRVFENRLCDHCKTAKRTRIMKTHNTKDCKIHGKEENTTLENKVDQKYSSNLTLYHDSGTSTTMINVKPTNLLSNKLQIPIFTASKNQPPEMGVSKGTINIGNLKVEAIEVPTFGKSLLSATQLARDYGCEQIIEPYSAKLTIKKDNKIIATGQYDESTKLIKMDEFQETSCTANVDDWIQVHRKLGHSGKAMINKTLKATTGITTTNKFETLKCDDCQVSKAKRVNIPKGPSTNVKDILEVIEIDIQGPFPLLSNDGTNFNLKLIDSKSGWLHYTTLKDCTANTVLDHFITYQTRLERQTGKKIKRIKTDGGVEYLKEFLIYLANHGLIKEKGIPYTKHHPGKAERAHQTILRSGRVNLNQSLLPSNMYNEAQRY